MEGAVWPVGCAGSAASPGWRSGPELALTRGLIVRTGIPAVGTAPSQREHGSVAPSDLAGTADQRINPAL
eukprot:8964228-Alexandrium_andersonii.AAC.1